MAFLGKKHNLRLRVYTDIFLPHLKESKRKGTHDEYILCDARYLPFKRKSFDIVLCLEVIEHLLKEDGIRLLANLEEIARRQIILSTPVGEKIVTEPNKVKELSWCHFSSWCPAEFHKLGYKVRGEGFPCIKGCLLVASTHKVLSLLGHLLYPIASPFVYFFPNRAGGMTCIKSLVNEATAFKETR